MKTKSGSLLNGISVLIMMVTLTCSWEKGECTTIDCSIPQVVTPDSSLIKAIKDYQDKYIRKSYAEWDCYTMKDYTDFQRQNTIDLIKVEFSRSRTFTSLLAEIGKLNETERNLLFKQGLATYQPTWRELHKVSEKGQTDAGQNAQKDIATAIVNLVKERCARER